MQSALITSHLDSGLKHHGWKFKAMTLKPERQNHFSGYRSLTMRWLSPVSHHCRNGVRGWQRLDITLIGGGLPRRRYSACRVSPSTIMVLFPEGVSSVRNKFRVYVTDNEMLDVKQLRKKQRCACESHRRNIDDIIYLRHSYQMRGSFTSSLSL